MAPRDRCTYRPESYDGAEVYKWFHGENVKGPESTTDENYRKWQELGTKYLDVGTKVENALKAGKVAWEGRAADQAQTVASPLAAWAHAAYDVCNKMANEVASQSGAWRETRDSVENPPNPGEKPLLNDWALWDTDYDEEKAKQDAANNKNNGIIKTYADQTDSNLRAMPEFIPPPPIQMDNGNDNPGAVDPGGRGTGNPGSVGGNTGSGHGSQFGGISGPGGSQGRPVPQLPPPNIGVPVDQVNPNLVTPPVQPPPNIGVPTPGPPPNPGLPGNPGFPGGMPPLGMPGGGGPGGGGGGRMGGGGGGFGPRGGFGPGGAGGSGFGPSGSAGVGADGHGPGGRPGAAGAAGRPGAGGPMGGGAGGARGGGDEDKEHKRPSYLVESDDIWGDNTLVAPPVIGETPPGYR
ncbi:hypothetical protein JOF53_003106 [Crossiella equi]|uniref:Uncharacterized protein n=1 Tax=Crossiella equi TaxID=130796 RepID=A0ABS5ADE2_9PSEU|nr:hypothetical protein [Crossiella equi]MBP2474234.1 hypothetical protein [Crossiella equi]